MLMMDQPKILSSVNLRQRLQPFCEKHHIRRLEVFGWCARGEAGPGSDMNFLVTFDEPVSTSILLEMAGEAEELVGLPVNFILHRSLQQSPNRFAREHIISSSVCLYEG